jgi:hypothetical protein
MKNNVLLLIVLLFAVAGVAAQPTSLNIYGLNERVKNVEEKSTGYIIDNGKDKKDFDGGKTTLYFDKLGQLTSKTVTSTEGVTEVKYDNSANGIRKAITETRRPFDVSNKTPLPSVSASVFKFDKEKNLLSEDTYTTFRQTGPDYVLNNPGQGYRYYFDDFGRMTKKLILDDNGKLVSKTEYFYRTSGPPTEEVETVGGRVIAMRRITYEFDSSNNWVKRTVVSQPSSPKDSTYKVITVRKIDYYK